MKRLTSLTLGVLTATLTQAAVQSPIDCHIFFDGTNTVRILWNAYPGKSYAVLRTTDLLGSWSTSPTLVATSNSLA